MNYDAGVYLPPRNVCYVKIVRLRDGCYFGFQCVIVAKSPVVTGPVLAKHREQRTLALLHYLQL